MKNLITFLAFLYSFCLFGQSSSIQVQDKVSPYFDEWVSANDFIIINNTVSGPVRIFTKIYDIEDSLVIGTDTPYFFNQFDTLILNDTLNAIDIFDYNRLYMLDPYASTFESKLYLPHGNYKINVVFVDTNNALIDSLSDYFFIDSLIGPTLLSPKDNREIYYQYSDSVNFKFLNRDRKYDVFYEYILKEIPINFNISEDRLEDVLLDTSITEFVKFTILADDTVLTFNEYSISPVFDTGALYVWAVREYLDSAFLLPIIANDGYSSPFIIKFTTSSSSTPEGANEDFFDCSSSMNGFESGTLNGWVCGMGSKKAGIGGRFKEADGIVITTTINGASVPGRHTIVTSGADSKVPSLSQLPTNGGNYALKLGNEFGGANSENVSITFTVTPLNSIIKLRYAVVLEDYGHDPEFQPLFRVRVFRKRRIRLFSSYSNITEPFIRLADESNPYFTRVPPLLIYGDWNCHQIDLSKFVGETVTLELATADCSNGLHFGYAYVDFCGAPSGNPVLVVDANYCYNEPVIANGSASSNLTAWQYTVEECLNSSGTRFGATEYKSKWYYGKVVQSDFNISEFLATNGISLNCNKYYRIKLGGNNFCSGWVEDVKVIHVICPSLNLAGPDRCIINGVNTVQIGSNAISGYTYSWSPSTCLSSSSVANPLFNKSLCGPQTYPLKYTLTSTYLGCSVSDEVVIFNSPPTIASITNISSNSCESEYSAVVIDGNIADLVWTYVDNGIVYSLRGNPIKIPLTANQITITVSLTNPCGTTSTSFTQAARTSNALFGDLPTLIVPTAMDPQNPNTRSLLIWEFGKSNGQTPAYGLNWYELSVYNRWGEKIYNKEEAKTTYYNGEIKWDGTANGKKVHDGVYVWILAMKNCAHAKTTQHTIMRLKCTGKETNRWKFSAFRRISKCSNGVYQYVPIYNQEKEDITVLNFSY